MNFTNESITQWIVDFMSKPENNNMKVLPGHGPETTIIREKEENPFLGFGWNK